MATTAALEEEKRRRLDVLIWIDFQGLWLKESFRRIYVQTFVLISIHLKSNNACVCMDTHAKSQKDMD